MISIKAKDMSTFLNRAYLGGKVSECVLQTTPEGMFIQAIDLTNTLLVNVVAPFETTLNAGPLGIGELGFLIKILDKFGDGNVDMAVEGNRLVLKGLGNNIKYLLSSPEAVPTAPEDASVFATIKDQCCYSVKLDEVNKGNLATNISLFKKPTVTVGIVANNGRGSCAVTCGAETENQFIIQFGRVTVAEGAEVQPFSFEIDASHVKEVIGVSASGEGTPHMLMAALPSYPVVISQGLDVWGFLPASRQAGAE